MQLDRVVVMDRSEVVDFIINESSLLDNRKFDEWLSLFAEDGVYWVPAAHGQQDHLTHVSLFYDDIGTLRTRVARLNHPQLHCQAPVSQSVRVLGMPRIVALENRTAVASCNFIMVEDRIDAPKRVFAGELEYTLVKSDDGIRIKRKKAQLTDCDQSFPAVVVPF